MYDGCALYAMHDYVLRCLRWRDDVMCNGVTCHDAMILCALCDGAIRWCTDAMMRRDAMHCVQ
jgi:hypothetical protein